MARYDWYILRIWRTGGRGGEQWAARLEVMPDGESARFNQPEVLLDHLRALIQPAKAGLESAPLDEERNGAHGTGSL